MVVLQWSDTLSISLCMIKQCSVRCTDTTFQKSSVNFWRQLIALREKEVVMSRPFKKNKIKFKYHINFNRVYNCIPLGLDSSQKKIQSDIFKFGA